MKTTAQLQTDQSSHRSAAESDRPLRETKGSAILDNRPEAVAQRRLAEAIHNSPSMVAQRRQFRGLFGEAAQLKGGPEEEELLQAKVAPVQRQGPEDEELLQGKFEVRQRKGLEEEEPLQGKFEGMSSAQLKEEAPKQNDTGLPDNLKSGIESLSGLSMDDVSVHYNSSHPARLNALAYTQGTEIHVAPGQEKHLPHEAWHVVQQAQGRVQPTMQMKDGVPVNDDAGLEQEADVMGRKAAQMWRPDPSAAGINTQAAVQERSGRAKNNVRDGQRQVVQRVTIVAGISVDGSTNMPTWTQDGERYHLNTTTDTHHVTKEGVPKVHYFFEGSGRDIKDKRPTKAEQGGSSKKKKKGKVVKTKNVFSDLPKDVQAFVKNNFGAILAAM